MMTWRLGKDTLIPKWNIQNVLNSIYLQQYNIVLLQTFKVKLFFVLNYQTYVKGHCHELCMCKTWCLHKTGYCISANESQPHQSGIVCKWPALLEFQKNAKECSTYRKSQN